MEGIAATARAEESMSKLPVGVKVVAAVDLAVSVGIVAKGVLSFLASVASMSPLGVLFALLQIGVALPFAFVAAGLWLGARWARTVTLFFATLGVAMNVIALLRVGTVASGWLAFAWAAGVVAYLGFDPSVRRAFRRA